jgi:hypothetical protein
MEKCRCKPSLTRCPLRGRNCCRPRNAGHYLCRTPATTKRHLSGQVPTFTLCCLHARPRRHPLSLSRAHPPRARRSFNPFGRALYQAFPADEARRVLRRLEFHYVPKHANWLNNGRDRDRRPRPPTPRSAHRQFAVPSPRPPPGRNGGMPTAPASNGCSQPKRPRQKAPVQSPQPNQANFNESKPLCRGTSRLSLDDCIRQTLTLKFSAPISAALAHRNNPLPQAKKRPWDAEFQSQPAWTLLIW